MEKVVVSPHFVTRPFESYGSHIPWIVSELVDVLGQIKAELVEGIFRKSGGNVAIGNLVEELDRGCVHDYSIYGPYDIACALKAFFREHAQNDALIPASLRDEMIALANIDASEAVQKLRALILQLPRVRLITLQFLMLYMNVITERADVN